MLCWNLPSDPKHRGWRQKNPKKTVLSLKGISSFAGNFVLICMKKSWYGSIYKELKLEMDFLTSRRLLQKIAAKNVSSLHQSMSIFQGWSLKLIWWLGKINVKKKYLMCQIPIKMLKQHATPNSSLHNLKIYSSKGCRKTSQRWIYVASYLANLANTAVLNIRIFSRRYHFRL